MVTSNKISDKKVVKMEEQNNSVVVPQRTLLGEVNEHITCPLCRGYYIDATTIVECLHSFCRSCIIKHLQVKSYCPVCEMMINSAKPNIKLDKALQDIVYKLVPGLFQKEMERRQTFYASRPGPAASTTPEQRGEDTERIIFSPEDVISFSLEYADATDNDSISSKSSDSNELQQQTSGNARRYLQCPAVVNISHLKKFLSMKFDIDSTQFAIDILYKRVPLPDYYTLMDIAYIYNWKRNEPMRFFYQIIDYVAIRNRLFDNNRKGSHFRDRKPSLASTEDTNAGSPAPNLNDHVSEASSGTGSPMPEENSTKQNFDNSKKNDSLVSKGLPGSDKNLLAKTDTSLSSKKNDDEVEKSQFLISFELTAKNSNVSPKTSPTKTSSSSTENLSTASEGLPKSQAVATSPKDEDTLKRKHHTTSNMPEMKKLKIELEKAVLPDLSNVGNSAVLNPQWKLNDTTSKNKLTESGPKLLHVTPLTLKATVSGPSKDVKQPAATDKQTVLPENSISKRSTTTPQNVLSPKRKLNNEPNSPTAQPQSIAPKTVSPLKLQLPKPEVHLSTSRSTEIPKNVKKIPDLKLGVPTAQSSQNKGQTVSKVRMDLLANNSDPTIDRSKILSQVKTSLSLQSPGSTSGDPLKSLFDSCKINIPSSLSITLTDQKQDPRIPAEPVTNDQKKNIINKNLSGANSTTSHKVPSPPVHNYIEILKLPDADPKKQNKLEGGSENKSNNSNKTENTATPPKVTGKSSESSAKGPIPNLKPIADTKLGKQTVNYSSPITFQQTFEQQLQTLSDKPTVKIPKNKAQVPKLVPATPKTFSVVSKLHNPSNKPNPMSAVNNPENKPSSALDLSTPNTQSQLSPHQTKAFETMQSIANLAKKQNLPLKAPLPVLSQNFGSVPNRPAPPVAPMRLPSMANMIQIKQDKINTSSLTSHTMRQDMSTKANPVKYTATTSPALLSPNQPVPSHTSPSTAQPSPRSTRSPSSSPKLVIAEDKQASNIDTSINQSNQISSTNINSASKSESLKPSPGPSKMGVKPLKPLPPPPKITGIRHPVTQNVKPNPSPADIQLFNAHHHALLRHQMEMNAWFKAQRQFMSNMAQAQNDFNKEKQ